MKVEIEIKDKLYTQDVDNFVGVVTDMINLYAAKNHDYGNSFDRGCEEIGPAYAIGRMYDKMNRIINLTRNPINSQAVKNESIKDTIRDLANYAVMYLAWIDKKNNSIVNKINDRIKFNNEEPTPGNYDISQSDAD
jgi:hypothetical protein